MDIREFVFRQEQEERDALDYETEEFDEFAGDEDDRYLTDRTTPIDELLEGDI